MTEELKQAAQQAIQAYDADDGFAMDSAISELRSLTQRPAAQATPDPMGEAVAWQRRDRNIVTGEWSEWHEDDDIEEELDPEWAERRPLFTHPAPGVPEGFALVPMTKAQVRAACKLALVSTPRSAEAWIETGIRFAEEHHGAMLAAAQAKGADHG